jgi:uncharacterized protein (DUF3084 family)
MSTRQNQEYIEQIINAFHPNASPTEKEQLRLREQSRIDLNERIARMERERDAIGDVNDSRWPEGPALQATIG